MKYLSPRQQTEYLELIREFPLIPIKSERHLLEAEKIIDRFLDEKKLAGGARAYFEVLCDLVANYEDEHYPIPMASDAELLEHLLEAKGVTQNQLHKDTGLAKSGISEILSGKKSFSKAMIGPLAEYFHVPTSVFTANIGKK